MTEPLNQDQAQAIPGIRKAGSADGKLPLLEPGGASPMSRSSPPNHPPIRRVAKSRRFNTEKAMALVVPCASAHAPRWPGRDQPRAPRQEPAELIRPLRLHAPFGTIGSDAYSSKTSSPPRLKISARGNPFAVGFLVRCRQLVLTVLEDGGGCLESPWTLEATYSFLPHKKVSSFCLSSTTVVSSASAPKEALSLHAMDGVLQDVVVMAAVVDVVTIVASVAGVAAARSLVAVAGLLVLATRALVMGLLHQAKASGLALPRRRLRLLARTRTATPPYTEGIVLPEQQRLPTPIPVEEPPRRPLIVRLHRPGSSAIGIGIIPDLNAPTAATTNGGTGFGPQAGSSNVGGIPAVTSFTVANTASGFAGLHRWDHGCSPWCATVLQQWNSSNRIHIVFIDYTAINHRIGLLQCDKQRGDAIGTRSTGRCSFTGPNLWAGGGRRPPPRHPPRHFEPSLAGLLLQPLKAGTSRQPAERRRAKGSGDKDPQQHCKNVAVAWIYDDDAGRQMAGSGGGGGGPQRQRRQRAGAADVGRQQAD
nr:unnamed protein product [Digitaria exilis]